MTNDTQQLENRAHELLNGGLFDEAASLFSQLTQQSPDVARFHHGLGVAELERGNTDAAKSSLHQALELDTSNSSYWIDIAHFYYRLGDKLKAAECMYGGSDFERAENVCRDFLSESPDDVDGHIILANILASRSKGREAEMTLRHAMKINKPLPPHIVELLDPEKTDIHTFSENIKQNTANRPRSNLDDEPFTFVVEIVDTCNLRCPSCPVGNYRDSGHTRGFMDVKLFEEICDKIVREYPGKKRLWLFNWGEPLMHPEVGKIIEIARSKGLYTMLSSNLNLNRNFIEAVKAEPNEWKISLSGYTQPVYGITHAAGDINLVKANMHLLRYYIDKYQKNIWVWAEFHRYRHNHTEEAMIQRLCKELGFSYQSIQAFLQPMEKVFDQIEDKLPEHQNRFCDIMLQHPLEQKIIRDRNLQEMSDCWLRTGMTTVGFTGTVWPCCSAYEPESTLGIQFLDHSLDEIQQKKYETEVCRTCYRHNQQWQARETSHWEDERRFSISRNRLLEDGLIGNYFVGNEEWLRSTKAPPRPAAVPKPRTNSDVVAPKKVVGK